MDSMDSWWSYVERWRGDATDKDIARALNISPSAITRWRQGALPNAANITDFARHFGRPVLEALVVAEIITADEAGQPPAAEVDLRQLGDDELVNEIRARLARYKGGQDHGAAEEAQEPGQGTRGEVDCEPIGGPITRAGLPAKSEFTPAARIRAGEKNTRRGYTKG